MLTLTSVGASARTLTRGFADDVYFDAGASTWVTRTVAAGATRVSLEIDWAAVEPKAPKPGSHPTSPKSPTYNFTYVDDVVKEVTSRGLQPVLLVTDAPRWAEAKGGTRTQEADGSYEPDAKAYGQLAQALATRYSGHFVDPASIVVVKHKGKHHKKHVHKRMLPRVRYFQAWAEANLGVHLSPQWSVAHNAYVNTGAQIYRGLLNSFYAGIKRGDRADTVITAGLAPYGDAPGGQRTQPVTFLKNVLCLSSKLTRQPCSESRAHFDVIASDPYEVGSPTTPAAVKNDASAPDLHKLTNLVGRALQAGTLLPRAPKPLWVTEFSYDSNPPNPQAISTATQARWLEESFYVFWREGVSNAIWYLIRDQSGALSTHYFSGVYFHNGRAKPSLVAYRFPFVVMRNGSSGKLASTASVWGISPLTGTVRVQLEVGHSWKTVFSTHVRAGNVFVRNVAATQTGYYRAVVDGKYSLAWKYS